MVSTRTIALERTNSRRTVCEGKRPVSSHFPRRVALVALAAAILAGPAPASAKTRTYTYTSPAVTLGGFETRLPKVRVRAPRVNGYVRSMDTRLIDSRGRAVGLRSVMLHHIVFINAGRPGTRRKRGSCRGRSGEPFYGTGEEHQRLILPRGYGYRLRRGDRWRMQAMLMSHTLRVRRVRVQYRIRVVTGRRLVKVRPFWIRANGCATTHPSYPVRGGGPPGSSDTKTWTWKVPVTGRIVAAGGHLHAGARDMFLSDPACGDRRPLDTAPRYAPPDDLVYRMRPILHEPGPVSTRFFLSADGIPIHRGQELSLTGVYDGERPRTSVMSIMHVYVAPTHKPRVACPPVPADAKRFFLRKRGSSEPPHTRVPLSALGGDGRIRPIDELPGPIRVVDGPATVDIRGSRFTPRRVSVPEGETLTWRFGDRRPHNAYFANGPGLISAPTRRRGSVYTVKLERPGTYQLFCYLHPVTMHQEVIVRPR